MKKKTTKRNRAKRPVVKARAKARGMKTKAMRTGRIGKRRVMAKSRSAARTVTATVKRTRTRMMKAARKANRSAAARQAAATRIARRKHTRVQPDLVTRATRTLRTVADTALGVTKTAIETLRP